METSRLTVSLEMPHAIMSAIANGYLDACRFTDFGDTANDQPEKAARFSMHAIASAYSICADFVMSCTDTGNETLAEWLKTNRTADSFGQNFWFSRNRHGCGFWDVGAGKLGDTLHAAAKIYCEAHVYVGDDGLVYFS